jgi:hypothetical protein
MPQWRPQPGTLRVPSATAVLFTLARDGRAKKYQFVTRSESGPKYWVFNTRSALMNLGFFNRHKPQAHGTNLDVRSEAWKAAKQSSDHLASGLLPSVLGGPSNNEIIGVMGQVHHGIRVGRCPTSRRADED